MKVVKVIQESSRVGIGSTIFRGLHRLYYRDSNEILYFMFNNPLYNCENENTWSTFLKQPFESDIEFIKNEIKEGRAIRENGIDHPGCPFLFAYCKQQNNGKDFLNKTIVQKYREELNPFLKFNDSIVKKVNEFENIHFKGKKVLSVHKRGTDALTIGHGKNQAHLFTYSTVKSAVDKIINDFDIIFLATDEEDIYQNMKNDFKTKVVSYSTIRAQSGDTRGLHHSYANEMKDKKYVLGEEAIIDMLLMSRCQYSLCSHSNLSLLNIIIRKDYNYEFLDDHVEYN